MPAIITFNAKLALQCSDLMEPSEEPPTGAGVPVDPEAVLPTKALATKETKALAAVVATSAVAEEISAATEAGLAGIRAALAIIKAALAGIVAVLVGIAVVLAGIKVDLEGIKVALEETKVDLEIKTGLEMVMATVAVVLVAVVVDAGFGAEVFSS